MKIVIIDTSIPINTRNSKIENSFKEIYPEAEMLILTWKRDKVAFVTPSNYIVYEAEAAYGNPTEKLKTILGFAKFARKKLRELQPDVIIASHWESLLVTPSDLPNKPVLIYENLDVPTGSYLIRKAIQILEGRKLKSFDLIIHASRFFQELYPESMPQIILENKSKFDFKQEEQSTHNPFVVSYIGTIRYKEILEHFVTAACSIDDIEVKIFGDGHDLEHIKAFSKGYKNISFYGSYSFSQIPEIYGQSDLVWAAYPNKDYNVVYAISNKFHESMACGKPCIYADKTKLGDFVSSNKMGYIVDPYSDESIKKLILNIKDNLSEYEACKRNILKNKQYETTWGQDFAKVVDFINQKLEERRHE